MSDLEARIKNYMGSTIAPEGHRLLAEALEEIKRLEPKSCTWTATQEGGGWHVEKSCGHYPFFSLKEIVKTGENFCQHCGGKIVKADGECANLMASVSPMAKDDYLGR